MQRVHPWSLPLALVLIVGLTCAGVALAGSVSPGLDPAPALSGGGRPHPAGNSTTGGGGVLAAPTGQFSYQGRLILDGSPYDGAIDIAFRLYSQESGGAAWWQETQTVQVEEGLFSVMLGAIVPLDRSAVQFASQQWLGIQPAGATGELTPRTLLGAAPYAMGLLPGTTVIDANPATPGYIYSLYIWSDNHPAVYGGSSSYSGIVGESWYTGTGAIGVVGRHMAAIGTEPGVYGVSASTAAEAKGVLGRISAAAAGPDSAGVRGIHEGNGLAGAGVWGSHTGGGFGVYGTSASGYGVYGVSTSAPGVYGSSSSASGLYGYSASGDPYGTAGVWGEGGGSVAVGVHGHREGSGAGVHGTTTGGGSGSGTIGTSENYVGVWAESGSDTGVDARTDRADNNYGLYTADNLYSLNYHLSGAVMQLVQNGGSAALEPGDVVVFSGMSAPLPDGQRVVQVARAEAAQSTAVAGVVFGGYNIAVVTEERDAFNLAGSSGREVILPGPVAPGEYLLIVVQGPAQVKVSGAVAPGELLSSAGEAGHAARAAELDLGGARGALPGTVLGKALEAADGSRSLLYIFVTLQ